MVHNPQQAQNASIHSNNVIPSAHLVTIRNSFKLMCLLFVYSSKYSLMQFFSERQLSK